MQRERAGGFDPVAIMAASASKVDLPFVLAFQAVRLLLVVALAPPTCVW
jgi:uncharacterized membrane protein AbrB (regulator of aidB expression)